MKYLEMNLETYSSHFDKNKIKQHSQIKKCKVCKKILSRYNFRGVCFTHPIFKK